MFTVNRLQHKLEIVSTDLYIIFNILQEYGANSRQLLPINRVPLPSFFEQLLLEYEFLRNLLFFFLSSKTKQCQQ